MIYYVCNLTNVLNFFQKRKSDWHCSSAPFERKNDKIIQIDFEVFYWLQWQFNISEYLHNHKPCA